MRWGLLGVRLTIIVVNLLIAAIIILSVLPLVTGGLRVDLPQNGEPRPTYQNGVVTISAPVDVYNGGYFDINDLTVRFRTVDGSYQITDYSSAPATILAGRTNHLAVELQVDLKDLPAEELMNLVFNHTTLQVGIELKAGYALNLVQSSVRTNQTMDWEPLISGFALNTGGVQTQTNGTNLEVLIPYSFQASDFVQGNSVSLHATMSNSSALIGSTWSNITIQQFNQGQLRFLVPSQAALWLAAHPEDLTIGTDLGFQGASVHQDFPYRWGGT